MLQWVQWSRWNRLGTLGLALLALVIAVAGWTLIYPSQIKLGFIGTLTGPAAQVGVPARDGVLLAIEECNQAGGIRGTYVSLLIGDDRSSAEKGGQLLSHFAAEGCWSVIGPTNPASAEMLAGEHAPMAMISPAIAADTIKDSDFFSVIPSRHRINEFVTRHVTTVRKFRDPLIVFENSQREAAADLDQALRAAGTNVAGLLPFRATQPMFDIAERTDAYPSDVVLLLAPSSQAAILIQHMRNIGMTRPIVLAGCTSTEDLMLYGGSAIEGLTFFSSANPEHPSDAARSFSGRFRKRFGYLPPLSAIHGYEATTIALLGIAQSSRPSDLPHVISAERSFEGLQGRIILGEPGTTRRELFAISVRKGMIQSSE